MKKIVIIGGTGLIGRKVAGHLQRRGLEVIQASPSRGIDVLTGEGLASVLEGADVVIDVSNSPSFEDKAVMEFFETAGRTLTAAEAAAGVSHHVALSVVGTERLQASGYFRAKLAQEKLIQSSRVPWTIVRATQFFEFVETIAQTATVGGEVRLSPAMMQPVYSGDVALLLAEIALEEPLNGTIELGGPEPIRMDDLVRRHLKAHGDSRRVVTDESTGYFGTAVDDRSLTPGADARRGRERFDDWLARTAAAAAR